MLAMGRRGLRVRFGRGRRGEGGPGRGGRFLKCELKGQFRAVLVGLGNSFASRGHLAMFRDLCGCDSVGGVQSSGGPWVEGMDAVKLLMAPRTIQPQRTKAENSWFRIYLRAFTRNQSEIWGKSLSLMPQWPPPPKMG